MNIRKGTTAAVTGALITIAPLTAAGTAQAAPVSYTTTPEGVTHEENPRVPEGAVWTEVYFPSSDGSGVELHADVLRPANLSASAKTPVILSVGPYFGHAGQTEPEDWTETGPSNRFEDFTSGADLFANGYTFVMADLRGFGGSTGCLDGTGPGEQADVKAAIQWSASQSWSTGKVGLYGKSYDAGTGLVGNDLKLPALKAVVAQEPTWNKYNYLFSNGVPRPNATSSPAAYNSIATIAPLADDTAHYQANATYEESHPECLSDNLSDSYNPDEDSAFWQERNLAAKAAGTSTPLFVTQGFIENNTKPEDMELYLDNHQGVERGWLGQWQHVRGNETDDEGNLLQGRAGFFDEVMRFYDQYLKGVRPTVEDPAYAIEDSTGAWRAQSTWPVSDSSLTTSLPDGEYLDDGAASTLSATTTTERRAAQQQDDEHAVDPAPPAGRSESTLQAEDTTSSYFRYSTPASTRVRITATPRITLDASAQGNVMVRLWDVAADGSAVMFDENVSLIEQAGQVSLDLKSTDWTLEAGHQLGVQIGTIDSTSWLDTPSDATIQVTGTKLDLELQNPASDVPTQGDRSPYLDTYLTQYTRTLTDVDEGTFSLDADSES
ncbi:CocE/NonD family hydrolase [Kineosporia sp. J2-2]|uniref:CocE/NonD family hydrolase n=1 Tax=Kineosporia corallincola TaxID=2835133 RepID=A0ABS5TFK5_9ACTN|nr:CocE/NonD family hydrolase [Kineosporia corallincola]MBT0769832.1 CocE/NonD family hydrolase [Kineosporia corallincola]